MTEFIIFWKSKPVFDKKHLPSFSSKTTTIFFEKKKICGLGHCGNVSIFLPLRFYVKSIVANFELHKDSF